jgi:hypothetical protein
MRANLNATIAYSLPPLSNIICAGIGKISGGHRNGTHSIVGIAAFVFIAWVARLWTMQLAPFGTIYAGAGILAVLVVAFAAKALKFNRDAMRKAAWVVGLSVGAFIGLFTPQEQSGAASDQHQPASSRAIAVLALTGILWRSSKCSHSRWSRWFPSRAPMRIAGATSSNWRSSRSPGRA